MTATKSVILGASLFTGAGIAAPPPPEAEIANGQVRARIFLPDAARGFYRGTRFDWSGMIGSLRFAGHEFFPAWFHKVDAGVHDFAFAGGEIVASPCTAATGPAEEFVTNGQALGFEKAEAGGTFVKIGVGVLRRPDEKRYDPYRLYPIVDGGVWTVTPGPDRVAFRQEVSDAATGYAYDYRKTVALAADGPRLALDHVLRNTGRKVIPTSVYNHNFLFLDRRAPGPGLVLTVPFEIQANPPLDPRLAEVRGRQLLLTKTLAGEDRVFTVISGFGAEPGDFDFRIESKEAGVGVRITGNRPLSRVALWSIRAPYSIEPFIDMRIEPGAEYAWRVEYEFYSTAGRGGPL